MKVEEVPLEDIEKGLYIPYEDLISVLKESTNFQTKGPKDFQINPPVKFLALNVTWKNANTLQSYINSFRLAMDAPVAIDMTLLLRGDTEGYKWNLNTRVDFTQLTLRYGSKMDNFIGQIASYGYDKNKYEVSMYFNINFYTRVGNTGYHFYGRLGVGICLEPSHESHKTLPCTFTFGVAL